MNKPLPSHELRRLPEQGGRPAASDPAVQRHLHAVVARGWFLAAGVTILAASMVAAAGVSFDVAEAQGETPPPIIDVHLHALPATFFGPPRQPMCPSPPTQFPAFDPRTPWPEFFASTSPCDNPIFSPTTDEEIMQETLEILERRNIVGVTSGPAAVVSRWHESAPDRIIPGLLFQLGEGAPTPEQLRTMHEEGRLSVLGEVTNQYVGIEPDDARFEPYLAMAEEIDIPVGIHIGTGPPGAPYLPGNGAYRARMHSPLSLEEPLLKHPRLRLYVMHAGWPMLDDTLAVMWAHPQLHLGLGGISHFVPRAAFHRYLRALVEAGFGKRVMFGSDQMLWPETLETAIASIESADFLTEEQKRDILYNNAARFLRLETAGDR